MSMVGGGEKMFFHKFFIIIISLVVQLSENVSLPHAIMIDPDIL
jgi:hypothetical protein